MVMKQIDATNEFVRMIDKSAKEWKSLKPQLDKKYHVYDLYAEDYFGILIDFSIVDQLIVVNGATVVDEEKYINFLLRFGNMHDD